MESVEQITPTELTADHAINMRGHHPDGRQVSMLLFDLAISDEEYIEGSICLTEETSPQSDNHNHAYAGLHKFRFHRDAQIKLGKFEVEVSADEADSDGLVAEWQVLAGVVDIIHLIHWPKHSQQ